MSKFITMSFYFMVFVLFIGIVQAGINWALNLAVGSDGEFQRPSNKEGNDWVSFDKLTDVANEVINNHKRLRDLKEKLESNSYQDSVVKYSGLGFLILSTIFTIFNRIQAVKRVARGEQGQGQGQGQITYPMVNQARGNSDIFGRASF